MPAFTLSLKAVAYDDDSATNNPAQSSINWSRTLANLPVENAETRKIQLDPYGTTLVFDGTRSLSVDGTTAFSLALSTLEGTRYRITHTGGAAPVFRTARVAATTGIALTIVVNSNSTIRITAGSGTPFANVQTGDIVFIPGTSTGDAVSPFNALNVGYWSVLARSNTQITASRLSGELFSGIAEVVTPAADAQFQAFTASGVQVGDTLEISAGFATNTQRSYEVLAVNPSWVEIQSTAPLGAETGISPGAAGFVVHTVAKRFLMIETNQEIVVRKNGDTGSTNRLSPIIAGDPRFVAPHFHAGPVWKLELVNRSSVHATVLVASAE